MVQFKPVKGKVTELNPEEVKILQNNDVKLLYFMCLLVQLGPKAENLVKYFNMKPGKVTAARWITTCTNILMLYCQTSNPPKNLILLTKIIVNIYAPSIFAIKQDWHVSSGPKHIFNLIQNSKQLLEKKYPSLYENVKNTILNNSYFLHIENLLVCMVHDSDLEVRNKALEIIENARKYHMKSKSTKVRRFQKPTEIKFDAQNYYELVKISEYKPWQFVSPPIFKDYSIEDLKNNNFTHDYLKVCVHNQHCERYVSWTSEAAAAVIGYQKRHYHILNKQKSTQKIPTKPTKEHFVNLVNPNVKRKLFE